MSDVDLYMMKLSPEALYRMTAIHRLARNVFRDAAERLYFGQPAFSAHGKVILFYGAYKDHVSICVGDGWVDFLKNQYPQFHYTRFTVTFPYDEPFPEDAVQVICELLRQNHGKRENTGAGGTGDVP